LAKLGVITDGIDRDLDVALSALTDLGLGYAELQFLWDKEVGDLTAPEMKRVKALVAAYEVKVPCISRYLFGHAIVGDTAVGDSVHRAEMHALERCIAMAQELDCPLVRIQSFKKEMILFGGGGFEQRIPTLDAWDRFIGLIEPAVALAEREQATLVVETANSGLVHSAYLARKLIDRIGSCSLKVLWDPANGLYCAENPWPEGFEELQGGRIAHVHIKDQIVSMRKACIKACRLGEGQMGEMLEPIATALRRDNYDGVICLEAVYRPDGGAFVDGFRASAMRFKEVFG
jgi:sugar phosphate isomerase/epimerase